MTLSPGYDLDRGVTGTVGIGLGESGHSGSVTQTFVRHSARQEWEQACSSKWGLWFRSEGSRMRASSARGFPNYLFIISAFVGALIAFLLPKAGEPVPHAHGMISAFVEFELNYMNLITSLGAVVLVYWVLKRKISGREALVVYGALGFVAIQLILASLRFIRSYTG